MTFKVLNPFDAFIACAQTTETVFPSEPRLNVSLRSGYGPLLHLETAADAQCPHDNATTYPKDATRHSKQSNGLGYWDPTRSYEFSQENWRCAERLSWSLFL